jgi:hypothetical protein
MRSLNKSEMQQISGGKNDNMTVNISLSVPAADAALFTDLYAKVSTGVMGITEFGQALASANLTNVIFTNFHISGMHFNQNANHPASPTKN